MTDPQLKQLQTVVSNSLREVFGENETTQKFVDVSRIPLICKNIEGMHETLGKLDAYIKDDGNWKKEFDIWKTQVVTPLIQKEADGKAVNGFVTKSAKYIAAIVGFLISLALLYNYIIGPLIKGLVNK